MQAVREHICRGPDALTVVIVRGVEVDHRGIVDRGEKHNGVIEVPFAVPTVNDVGGALGHQGCELVGDMQASEFGKFGWVLDPEGNKVELWEPPPGQ